MQAQHAKYPLYTLSNSHSKWDDLNRAYEAYKTIVQVKAAGDSQANVELTRENPDGSIKVLAKCTAGNGVWTTEVHNLQYDAMERTYLELPEDEQ